MKTLTSTRSVLSAAGLAALLVGCGGLKKDDPLPLPDLPEVPTLPLPKAASGAYVLFEAASSAIELDPTSRDPLTALGRCADLVTYCRQRGESVDACMGAAPACTTAQPWEERSTCCPSGCQKAYGKERAAGKSERQAFEQVFFTTPDCFPGVAALVAGAP